MGVTPCPGPFVKQVKLSEPGDHEVIAGGKSRFDQIEKVFNQESRLPHGQIHTVGNFLDKPLLGEGHSLPPAGKGEPAFKDMKKLRSVLTYKNPS